MTIVSKLEQWWASRSDDQRQALTESAQRDRMDAATARLLLGTGCPIGPIGSKWETQPDYSWMWPQSVRAFVTAQSGGG
jgi:hypothetical protein